MSFCVNGAKFNPNQYYRDDGLARTLLETCGENPVLLTGLRRIGKSWFLRRLDQILTARATRHFAADGAPIDRPLERTTPLAVVVLEGGNEALPPDLDKILSRGYPDLLLAVDELEKLVDDPRRADLLDRVLAYRPLVLAAAPVIHELARDRAPRLASFFEEQCVPMVLRPLGRGERRALALQTCDPGTGVPGESEHMATWWDWGGHPLVLQQIGDLLKGGHASDAQKLMSLAHAGLNLGGPRYGHSLTGESGLSRAQRAALADVSAGKPLGDDHAAAVLQDHGAIVQRKGRWAIENCVLRRYLQGASDSTAPAGSPAPPPVKAAVPIRVFSWIHLSDLHFGAGTEKHRFDHRTVMRAIVRDIEANAPRAIDRLVLTGDIAWSGKREEYVEAKGWLEKTAKAAGVGLDRVRVVPGNHDVDRALAKTPLARLVHHGARSGVVDLDTLLADAEARGVLTGKLGEYLRFSADVTGHPTPIGNGLDWFETVPAAPARHGPIRMVGLSTVWISDEHDGNPKEPFIPNLLLANGPIDTTLGGATSSELVFVLSHHPPSWIHKDAAILLDRELARLSHIHLCGHVHDAEAGGATRFGRSGKAIRYVAGAAHGDPSESAKHGYAWGAVRYDPATEGWQAGWAPRIFVQGEMCADSTGRRLDDDGFAWEPIDCRWPAPGA